MSLRVVAGAAMLCGLLSAAPEVLKVEPPNWWVGHSINPVRVLIRGRELGGARIRSNNFQVARTRVNAAGTYLFTDVIIAPSMRPGQYKLKIDTPGGTTTAPFEISAPLSRPGRFQGFSPDDVIYLIMPDRFANGDPSNDEPMLDRAKQRYYHGGDLRGIIDHLPYLKDLGVTALWLTPLYDNVNHLNERETPGGQPITDYHGYGAVDFYGVEEHFGDLKVLRELVDAAHHAGLKIILDQVENHTGPYHPWVKDSPTPTWFHGTEAHHLANNWRTWTLADPHSPPFLRKATLEGWFIDILPDLNQEDPEVARYLIQNTLWWMGVSGIDGIRQDTWPYVPRVFWRKWMAAIKREYPRARVVGEVFDGDPAMVSSFQSDVDSLFDFPLYYAVRHVFAEGKPMKEIPETLAHDRLYSNPGSLVTFLGLHDVARFMNEPGASVDGLKLAFTFLMTSRGIPMVYYGDEIAMPGGGDPDNRRDFPGGWQSDPRNAFTAAGRTLQQQDLLEHVQRLTQLRAKEECLRRGEMLSLALTEDVYAYSRGACLIVLNNGKDRASLEVPLGLKDGEVLRDGLGSHPDIKVREGTVPVSLSARSAAVFVAPAGRSSPAPAN